MTPASCLIPDVIRHKSKRNLRRRKRIPYRFIPPAREDHLRAEMPGVAAACPTRIQPVGHFPGQFTRFVSCRLVYAP